MCSWPERRANCLKHPAVLSGGQAGQSFEQSPEKRNVFVPGRQTDGVHRLITVFQSPLGGFHSQVLKVLYQGASGRILEPTLQCPLRNVQSLDQATNRPRVLEVLLKPLLTPANHRVGVRGPAYQRRKRQLPLSVPFEQIYLGKSETPLPYLRSAR